MFLTWKGDMTGLDLQPKWEIESAQVHYLKRLKRGDQILTDVYVLHVRTTSEQTKKLLKDYEGSIESGILGLPVMPIIPGQPIWVWRSPTPSLKDGSYSAFEITSD